MWHSTASILLVPHLSLHASFHASLFIWAGYSTCHWVGKCDNFIASWQITMISLLYNIGVSSPLASCIHSTLGKVGVSSPLASCIHSRLGMVIFNFSWITATSMLRINWNCRWRSGIPFHNDNPSKQLFTWLRFLQTTEFSHKQIRMLTITWRELQIP